MPQTISSFLSEHLSASKAIGALNKEWLSYGALRELTQKVNTTLRKSGISKKDRVAIVLPNGPPWPALSRRLLSVQLLRR